LAARSTGEALGGDQFQARPAAEVLADRLAMALVHHEPGWRLPRHTVLARRYSVSTAEIDAAISALVGRHLVRRLPDGQVHRVSPAEYLIPLEGIPGLRSRIDPMAGELALRTRQTSWRRAPEDIAWALRVDPAALVWVVHTVWAAGDEPAAYVTTYLPADRRARSRAPTRRAPMRPAPRPRRARPASPSASRPMARLARRPGPDPRPEVTWRPWGRWARPPPCTWKCSRRRRR
jgi:hypothetical protein